MLAPFRGIRYARDRVSGLANVTSPPYDVISGGVLEHLRAADPHNVVRLILPGQDANADQAAASLLREWLSTGVLIRDRMPALYLYEQTSAASSWRQRGIIGLVHLGSPQAAGILPHEGVLPGLVADRRELMAATQSNLEPIFLVYDGAQPRDPGCPGGVPARTATEVIDEVAAERTPLVTIDTEDGVTHRLWRIGDPAEQAAITADLCGRRALIADGHHRYAAYMDLQSRARASGRGVGPWDFGLAFLVDSSAYPPRLGAIHRVLPGLAPERAAELAKAAFTVQDLPAGTDLAGARRRLAEAGCDGTAFLLAGGPGFQLLSNPDPVAVAASMPTGRSAPWRSLDASVLQQLLLGRLWGITDSERDVLIYHDADDAVGAVCANGSNGFASGTAVISNPVSFDAVIQIAALGERVPRKSTSFGPKPRTGLVLRTFGPNEEGLAGLGQWSGA
ncbi:MAG TPA: DUF1015 domain-containing protein [Streptosporangiaceae bacterium]|nr:DUF1015 domain-containing protein [Streptosporangiaceae bacterium]